MASVRGKSDTVHGKNAVVGVGTMGGDEHGRCGEVDYGAKASCVPYVLQSVKPDVGVLAVLSMDFQQLGLGVMAMVTLVVEHENSAAVSEGAESPLDHVPTGFYLRFHLGQFLGLAASLAPSDLPSLQGMEVGDGHFGVFHGRHVVASPWY